MFSRASSLCSSLALKQVAHLLLLKMLGTNLRQSALDDMVQAPALPDSSRSKSERR